MGVGALALVSVLGIAIALDPDARSEPVALALAAGVAVIFSGIGLWCLHLARTQRYGIEIGREGLRPLVAGTAGHVSWAEIAELRERPLLERVELCSPGGEVRARLEYQLENFEEALAAVIAQVRPAPHLPTQGSRIEIRALTAQPGFVLAILAASAAFAFVSWRFFGESLPLVLPGLLLAGAVADHFLRIREVEVRDGQLRVHAKVDRPAVDLSAVTELGFALQDLGRGRKRLEVQIVFANGEKQLVRPPGVDAFALYRLIAEALPEASRTTRSAG